MITVQFVAGLGASLVCLLLTGLVLVMLNDWDRPRQDRGWQQAESVRGIFDDRPPESDQR